MYEVIKSSRFWIAIVICISCLTLAVLKIVTGDMAIGTMMGILAGFGVGKTWGNGNPAVNVVIEKGAGLADVSVKPAEEPVKPAEEPTTPGGSI